MLGPLWSQYHIGPELAKIGDTAGGGTEHRRIAHQQFAGKRIRPRLQQSIKGCTAALCEGMRRRVRSIACRASTSIFVAAKPVRSRCGK